MVLLSKEFIRNNVADTTLIFQRGETIYHHGSYFLSGENRGEDSFVYQVDGSYGDYTTRVALKGEGLGRKGLKAKRLPSSGMTCSREVTILSSYNPDIIILDEAQRIKNFSTKTADAVKRIPKRHGIVLTGTPLENKLEDVYSIVQFLDPYLLTPLWQFAADHFLLLKNKKSNIAGYRNLDLLKEKLKGIVIRRKKEDVLRDLPDEVVNNYYIDLNREQLEMHGGYARSLMPLINKKYLTPMDLRKIQVLLLRMKWFAIQPISSTGRPIYLPS